MIDNKLAPYGAFVLRVALGVMFLAHAYLKFGYDPDQVFCSMTDELGFAADRPCEVIYEQVQ